MRTSASCGSIPAGAPLPLGAAARSRRNGRRSPTAQRSGGPGGCPTTAEWGLHRRFKSSQAQGRTRDSEAEPDPPRRPPRRGVGSLDRRQFLEGCAAVTTCGIAASMGSAAVVSSPRWRSSSRQARQSSTLPASPPAFSPTTASSQARDPCREGEPLRVRADQSPRRADQPALPRTARPAGGQRRQRLRRVCRRAASPMSSRPGRLRRHLLVSPSPARPAGEAALAGLAGPLVIVRRAAAGAQPGSKSRSWSSRTSACRRPPEAPSGRRLGPRQERRLMLVNGQVRPSSGRAPLVRLRLVNACNARMLLLARGDGRPLHVIAHDGHLLEAPRPLAEVLLTPAQRLDLLLALGRRRRAAAQALQPRRPARAVASRAPVQRAPAGRTARRALAGAAGPVERLDPSDVAVRRSFRMAMAFLAPDGQGQLAPIGARLGDLELWEITNVDTQDHVFHLHTWPFQVWRRDGVSRRPGLARHDQPRPGRAGRDPDPVSRLRREKRLSLPHRRARRCRHDGHHRGARTRPRARRRATPRLRRRDLPLRVIRKLDERQAGIGIRRDQPAGAQLEDQPRPRRCARGGQGLAGAPHRPRPPCTARSRALRLRRHRSRASSSAPPPGARRRAWRGPRPAPASGSRGRPRPG